MSLTEMAEGILCDFPTSLDRLLISWKNQKLQEFGKNRQSCCLILKKKPISSVVETVNKQKRREALCV
jgi:hypothetical protein